MNPKGDKIVLKNYVYAYIHRKKYVSIFTYIYIVDI